MNKRALIYLNIAIVAFSFAGLFGKWIELPSFALTFGRVLFSSMTLALFMLATRQSFRIEGKKDALLLVLAGVIMTVHWWAVFQSIQMTTVAVGVITFSTFPLFLTFLEPAIKRERLNGRNVLIAVIIVIGVLITIPEFSLDNNMFKGIMIGMISPVAYSILTLLNKGLTAKYTGTLISFYEQATATLVLLPFVLGAHINPTMRDIGLLLIFGTVTTAFAHTLFISCLKHVPAQLAGICSSMETVYGILLALALLGEVPSMREIIGGIIVTVAVIYAQIKKE